MAESSASDATIREEAMAAREDLEGRMTASQITEAQSLVQ